MIELVIANNDEMALGAVSALQSAGYNKSGGVTIPVLELTQPMRQNRRSAVAQWSAQSNRMLTVWQRLSAL